MNKKIVITSAQRTIGSYGKSLNISAVDLSIGVISEVIKKSKIEKNEVDEIILGQVLTGGLGQNPARQTAIKCGLLWYPAYVVNQVCGSGLRSVVSIPKHKIR